MNRKLLSVILALVAVLIVFLLIAGIGPLINPSLKLDNTALLRFVFVGIGLLFISTCYARAQDMIRSRCSLVTQHYHGISWYQDGSDFTDLVPSRCALPMIWRMVDFKSFPFPAQVAYRLSSQ